MQLGSQNWNRDQNWLVVWNIVYDFPYIGNFIIPTDELIFFRGVGLNHQPENMGLVLDPSPFALDWTLDAAQGAIVMQDLKI